MNIVSISNESDRYAVSLRGLLNNQTCLGLYEQLDKLATDRDLLIDLTDLEEIDASGLGSVVSILAKFVSNGRKVKTINCFGQPRSVVFGLNMDKFLNVHPRRSSLSSIKRDYLPDPV